MPPDCSAPEADVGLATCVGPACRSQTFSQASGIRKASCSLRRGCRTCRTAWSMIGSMPMDIGDWLRGLGLEQYAASFRDNDIDADILPELTAEDLTGLGVASIGHRRKLLDAVSALRGAPEAAPAASQPARDTGDQRRPRGRAAAVDDPLLRCGRLYRVGDTTRSRGFARGDWRLSPVRRRGAGALRRVCREVHGRRHPRLFRLSASARGGRRTGGPRGAGHRHRGERARLGAAARGAARHRDRPGRGRRPARRRCGAGAIGRW